MASGEVLPEDSTVTITASEYTYLTNRDNKLMCLENAGVDNWDGYDFALEEYTKEYEELL